MSIVLISACMSMVRYLDVEFNVMVDYIENDIIPSLHYPEVGSSYLMHSES